jgi:hypothetical protein
MQGTEEVAVITEDVTSSKKEIDMYGFGSGEEDHDALRCLILEYRDVLSPRTETAAGVEYEIVIKAGAYMSRLPLNPLNRPIFRKSPKEQETEREEISKLLDRRIVQPSSSCYGTNNVFVERRSIPMDLQPA